MHFFLCKIKLISINKINLFKLHRKKYSIIKLLYSFKQARQQRKCELCRLCWTKKDEVSKNCFFLYHKFVFPHHFSVPAINFYSDRKHRTTARLTIKSASRRDRWARRALPSKAGRRESKGEGPRSWSRSGRPTGTTRRKWMFFYLKTFMMVYSFA